MLNHVTTGNVAEVAAITLFLRFYSDDNPDKCDYNSDKQQCTALSTPTLQKVLALLQKVNNSAAPAYYSANALLMSLYLVPVRTFFEVREVHRGGTAS